MIKYKTVKLVAIGILSLGLVACGGEKDYTDYYNNLDNKVENVTYTSNSVITNSYEREVLEMFQSSNDYMRDLGLTMDNLDIESMHKITDDYTKRLNLFNVTPTSDTDLLLNDIVLKHYSNMMSCASAILLYVETKDFEYINLALEYAEAGVGNMKEASDLVDFLSNI